jgi:hypothetical protein
MVPATLTIGSRTPAQNNREAVDSQAAQLVLQTYRDACDAKSREPFAAALNTYLTRYPQIGRALARHAVAYILATAGE